MKCPCLDVAGGLNFTRKDVPIEDCFSCKGTGVISAPPVRTGKEIVNLQPGNWHIGPKTFLKDNFSLTSFSKTALMFLKRSIYEIK